VGIAEREGAAIGNFKRIPFSPGLEGTGIRSRDGGREAIA